MTAAEEQQLILRAKSGSNDAFRQLIQRYMKKTYDVAYRFVGDHDSAEDIAQEAFVRIHASLGSFRGDSEFATWLHRITVNLSLNQIKRDKRKSHQSMDERHMQIPASGNNHDIPQATDRQIHIEKALHELPTLQRAVVILRHLNGLSTRQVSQILRCSEGTVKTHLYRGLNKLRKKLDFLREDVLV